MTSIVRFYDPILALGCACNVYLSLLTAVSYTEGPGPFSPYVSFLIYLANAVFLNRSVDDSLYILE